MWQDLRYALRQLAKNPGFSVIAALTLALGIGANTAIFSAVDALLLHPLPYRNPEQLVYIAENLKKFSLNKIPASPPEVMDYRRMATSFSHQAAIENRTFTLTGRGDPESVGGLRVSAAAFSMLDVKPILGTVFNFEDEDPGKDHVAVISEGLWKRRFGSDPAIVGQNILMNQESYRVLGVIHPFLEFRSAGDVWVPLSFKPAEIGPGGRGRQSLDVVARLKPGVSLAQANAEMQTVAARIARENPQNYPATFGYSLEVDPLAERVTGDLKTPLLVLLAAVGAVMLIACANVSNLLLARAVMRRKEMSIRAALGAARSRVIRQLLTESVLLAIVAGVLGMALAYAAVYSFSHFGPREIVRNPNLGINLWVMGFTMLLSLAASVIFGLAPALEASRVDLNDALKEGSRGSSGGRRLLRESMVALEVAASLVLLIGAGLLVRSFIRLERTDPGFRPDHLLTFQLTLPPARYRDPAQLASFQRALVEKMRALPGVTGAGITDQLPFSNSDSAGSFGIVGRAPNPGEPTPVVGQRKATPGLLETLGVPLLRGRYFETKDDLGTPLVAMVNDQLVKKYFPKEDPIGLKIVCPNGTGCEIIGVVGSVKHRDLAAEPNGGIYFAGLQQPAQGFAVALRTAGDPLNLAAAVRKEVASLDPDLPIARIATMEQRLADSVAQQRFSIQLMTVFAGIAAVLAAIGIYGVLSYLVDQRRRELGIRVALGAQPSSILGLVLRQGSIAVGIGLFVGIAGAFALTRLLSNLLYQVSATDPLVFGGVAAGLIVVALVAMLVPARRATRVDPLEALRHE
ncbi:MAG TPA: ABC transporter permease [Bryobacteraceae bacterium]|nr:ABC transporter permease [Bryobacteraceae bacterium]